MNYAASCEKNKLMVNSGNNSLSKIKHPPTIGKARLCFITCAPNTLENFCCSISNGEKGGKKKEEQIISTIC
jgi:hypothetical protein